MEHQYLRLDRTTPFFPHDCKACRYRGSMVEVPKHYENVGAPPSVMDVYVHSGDGRETIVRRTGAAPDHYESFPRVLIMNLIIPQTSPTDYWHDSWAATMQIVTTAHLSSTNLRGVYEFSDDASYSVVRAAEHYRNEEQRVRIKVIEFDELVSHQFTESALHELLVNVLFPRTFCQHSHDCCGNWYTGRSDATRLPNGRWLVTQHQHVNI